MYITDGFYFLLLTLIQGKKKNKIIFSPPKFFPKIDLKSAIYRYHPDFIAGLTVHYFDY